MYPKMQNLVASSKKINNRNKRERYRKIQRNINININSGLLSLEWNKNIVLNEMERSYLENETY